MWDSTGLPIHYLVDYGQVWRLLSSLSSLLFPTFDPPPSLPFPPLLFVLVFQCWALLFLFRLTRPCCSRHLAIRVFTIGMEVRLAFSPVCIHRSTILYWTWKTSLLLTTSLIRRIVQRDWHLWSVMVNTRASDLSPRVGRLPSFGLFWSYTITIRERNVRLRVGRTPPSAVIVRKLIGTLSRNCGTPMDWAPHSELAKPGQIDPPDDLDYIVRWANSYQERIYGTDY